MRTSTRTPRLSWFKCFPADFVSNPAFIAMSALARGAYWSLLLFSWNGLCQGRGLPINPPENLQRIAGMTPLEWDSIKTEVLSLFELRDEMYYSPWLEAAAIEASEKCQKQKDASEKASEARAANAAAKNSSAPRDEDKIDETDEIRLDKNGRPYGQPSSASLFPSQTGVATPDAAAGALPLRNPTGVAPLDPAFSPLRPSGAPLCSAPSPLGKASPQEKQTHPDIEKIRKVCIECEWKLPHLADVQRLLAEASADDICAAIEHYDSKLNANDRDYAEHTFFVEGGGGAVIRALARG